jgi:hypothetical protein
MFDHLNIPNQWKHEWTKYPEGYTILEALISWVNQVNSMVDNQNDLSDKVTTFRTELDDFINQFDDDLTQTVESTLSEWQQSGYLDVVIDAALQTQMDVLEEETQNKLNDFNEQLAQTMDDLSDRSINVKLPFGTSLTPCKVDGITDDTANFNAIYQYAFENGLSVFIPGQMLVKGSIGLNTSLTNNRSFPSITGNKATSTPQFLAGSVTEGSAIIVDGVGVSGLEIKNTNKSYMFCGGALRDIAIIKKGNPKKTDGSIGLSILGATEFRFYNVSIMGFDIGFKNEYSWTAEFFGLTTIHNNIGILLEDNSNAIRGYGVQAHQNNIGVKILSGNNIGFDGITVEGQDFGFVITKGSAALVPSNISFSNIYTEANTVALGRIGVDENGVTSEQKIFDVSLNNLTINGTEVIPLQLDNVTGVKAENVTYQNSISLYSATKDSSYINMGNNANYDGLSSKRYAQANRQGYKNNYNLIPNGYFQFPSLRILNQNTGWNVEFDNTILPNERCVSVTVPTGQNLNTSTQYKIKIDSAMVGKRLVLSGFGFCESGLDAALIVYDENNVAINKLVTFTNSPSERYFDFACPDGEYFTVRLRVTNNSGLNKKVYLKHIVLTESGVSEVQPSPLDLLYGFSGRVSGTPTGVTIPLQGYAADDYNVIVMPNKGIKAEVTKSTDSFTITTDVNGLVYYTIIPLIGLYV